MSDDTNKPEDPEVYGEDVENADKAAAWMDQPMSEQVLREKGEPDENFHPVNMALLFMFAILAFWGGSYMFLYSGISPDGVDLHHYNENLAVGGGADEGPKIPLNKGELFALGQREYAARCATCHQANGQGLAGAFPPLAGSEWVVESKDRVINILLSGLNGPITVMGNEYNGNMPPFGSAIKDEKIAAILTFVRTNAEWGNEASWVSEAEVAAQREAVGVQPAPWTAEQLLERWPHGMTDGDPAPAAPVAAAE